MSDTKNFEDSQSKQQHLFSGLTLTAIFAMQDELRNDVIEAVKLANSGSIQVRLISGDNLKTAISFAIEAGIVKEDEQYTCTDAYTLIKRVENDDVAFRHELFDHDENNFAEKKLIKVVGRVKPNDKKILT